ncbi:MAG TPA: hypothetical protein VKS44_05070 [Candidatus Acidoferrales bacterium]|nr:hypothetical protein [Candidatus Acidoferrales bacterium]
MSSQVGDLDNDGFAEIVLGTGNPELDWTEPKLLFCIHGKGHFVDSPQPRVWFTSGCCTE